MGGESALGDLGVRVARGCDGRNRSCLHRQRLAPEGGARAVARPDARSDRCAGVTFAIRAGQSANDFTRRCKRRPSDGQIFDRNHEHQQIVVGLLIEPGPSGASTDTGLDLKAFSSSIARGFKTCSPCTNVPDAEWIVLQPNQTDNAIVGFFAYGVREPQRHKNAENADLTLILLIKEAGRERHEGSCRGLTSDRITSFSESR